MHDTIDISTPEERIIMEFHATLAKALEASPAAFAVVQTNSGEFVAAANAGTEREIIRTLGGSTVWVR